MVLCCDQFDHGSRQAKCEPVDLVMEDYAVSFPPLTSLLVAKIFHTLDLVGLGFMLITGILMFYIEFSTDKRSSPI